MPLSSNANTATALTVYPIIAETEAQHCSCYNEFMLRKVRKVGQSARAYFVDQYKCYNLPYDRK